LFADITANPVASGDLEDPRCESRFSPASGVNFGACYPRRTLEDFDGVTLSVMNVEDLRLNKRASGRHKDLADLDNLP
jgi:hypothetical protein